MRSADKYETFRAEKIILDKDEQEKTERVPKEEPIIFDNLKKIRNQINGLNDIDLRNLIIIYKKQKDQLRLLVALEELWHRSPQDRLLLEIARLKTHIKDYEGSIKAYRRYLAEQKDDVYIHQELADIIEKLHGKNKASAYLSSIYRKILEQDPDNSEALLQLGKIAADENNLNQAVYYLERYIDVLPPNPEVLFQLGEVRLLMGKEASHLFKQAYSLLKASEKEPNQDRSISIMRAKIQDRLGNYEDALKQYAELIRKYPGEIDLFADYLELLIQMKEYQKALDELCKTRFNEATDLNLLLLHSQIHQALGNYEKALKLLQKAECLYPENIVIKKNIAANYYLLGKDIQSLHYLQKAEQLNPYESSIVQDMNEILRDYADHITEYFEFSSFSTGEDRLEFSSTLKYYFQDHWYFNANHIHESSSRDKNNLEAETIDLSFCYQHDRYHQVYLGGIKKYGEGVYVGANFRLAHQQAQLRLGYREPWNEFFESRNYRGEQSSVSWGINGNFTYLGSRKKEDSFYGAQGFYKVYHLDRNGDDGYARGGYLVLGQNFTYYPTITLTLNLDLNYINMDNESIIPIIRERFAPGIGLYISDNFSDYWKYLLGGGYENNLEHGSSASYYMMELGYNPLANFEIQVTYRHEQNLLTKDFGFVDQVFIQADLLF